jgi:hypothetical protein
VASNRIASTGCAAQLHHWPVVRSGVAFFHTAAISWTNTTRQSCQAPSRLALKLPLSIQAEARLRYPRLIKSLSEPHAPLQSHGSSIRFKQRAVGPVTNPSTPPQTSDWSRAFVPPWKNGTMVEHCSSSSAGGEILSASVSWRGTCSSHPSQ